MGLYDAPSPTPASMSFLSGPWDIPLRPSLGKGLKLEETFQPAPIQDEESDAGQGDDDEDDDEEEEEEDEAEQQSTFRQTPDLTMPSYYEQTAFGETKPTSDFNGGADLYWSAGLTGHYGWV